MACACVARRRLPEARDQVDKLDRSARRFVGEGLLLHAPAGGFQRFRDERARLGALGRAGGARAEIDLLFHLGHGALAGEFLPELERRRLGQRAWAWPFGAGVAKEVKGGLRASRRGRRCGWSPARSPELLKWARSPARRQAPARGRQPLESTKRSAAAPRSRRGKEGRRESLRFPRSAGPACRGCVADRPCRSTRFRSCRASRRS